MGKINAIFKANPSNDLYLGGRLSSFKNKNLDKLLKSRYKEMMCSDNIGIVINAEITKSMTNELNSFFGKLPASTKEMNSIVNGNAYKLNANFIHSNI